MKLPLILPIPLLAPAFISIFAPRTAPRITAPPARPVERITAPQAERITAPPADADRLGAPSDLDRIGYDTIKNAPPEAGKAARAANLAALFGGGAIAAAPAPPAAVAPPAPPVAPAAAAPPAPPPSAEELTDAEIQRYSRHLILEDVGVEGQKRLKSSKVAVVGAGGLGSPALLYLAAAGVGTLTIVDDDTVETSNLQRQIVHDTDEVGSFKAASAASAIRRVNPLVQVHQLRERLTAANAVELLGGHDIVLDGCDNFDTKYAIDDACKELGMPSAYAAILRFEGQASTFNYPPGVGPTYRDLMPEGPAPGTVPSCAEGGVLGVLPGVLGCVQATEILKVLLGRPASDCLAGRVLVYDALRMTFREIPLVRSEQVVEALVEEPVPKDAHTSITAAACAAKLRAGWAPYVLDVRLPQEAEICQLPFADVLCPHRNVKAAAADLPRDADILIHCKGGFRSRAACRDLASLGFDPGRLYDMTGGILAWARDVDPRLPTY